MPMTTGKFNFLLQHIRDEDNFQKIYWECYPLIIKYANYLFGGKNLGRDIAQDIFKEMLSVKTMSYIKQPRAWLYTLCKNKGLKYLSKDVLWEKDAPYVSFVEKYDEGNLEIILSVLNAEEREIIELKYISEFSLKEIAIIKNRSYAAVLKQHNRILKKLEKKVVQKNII